MDTENLQKEHIYALFEYDILNDRFLSNREYINNHQSISLFIDKLTAEAQSGETNSFAFSFPIEANPKATSNIFYCDFFSIKKDNEIVRIIGTIKPQSLNLI